MPLEYSYRMPDDTNPTPNPVSFSFRLRASIAQMERETKEGVDDWSTLIQRMRDILPALEAEELAAAAK